MPPYGRRISMSENRTRESTNRTPMSQNRTPESTERTPVSEKRIRQSGRQAPTQIRPLPLWERVARSAG